jgi:hypothetical protein
MYYTEEQLNSLIADVEKEFTSHLAKAEKSFGLAKSEDDQPDQKKVNGAADDKKNSAKDEKTSASENKDGGKADDSHNAAKDEKQEDGDAKKEASQDKSGKPIEGEKAGDKGVDDQHQQQDGAKEGQADEGHGYDDEDMDHMHQMYSSMSKPELKAHHDTIRKCLESQGMAKCEDGMAKAEMEDGAKDAEGYRPNGGPHDGEAAKSKTAPASDDQALEKSEKNIDEVALLKSELEAVKAKSVEEKQNLETALQNFLTKFVEKTAPAGKAITSLDIIAKTEDSKNEKVLTKSEIDAKLLAKSRDSSTSTDDRKAINSYYFSKNYESVRHLLS